MFALYILVLVPVTKCSLLGCVQYVILSLRIGSTFVRPNDVLHHIGGGGGYVIFIV